MCWYTTSSSRPWNRSRNGTDPSAPVTSTAPSSSTIGSRRRAAAIASPSRVCAFSRTHLVEPWSTGLGEFHSIRPWETSHENQGFPHDYHHPSVVTPPRYDTNLDTNLIRHDAMPWLQLLLD